MTLMTRVIVLAAAACLAWAPAAQASVITLSNDDSGGGGGVGLDASIDFIVSGSTLTVSFTNNSSINAKDIYFNSASATSLSLTGISANITNYSLVTGGAGATELFYGAFDFKLNKGGGNAASTINPGETAVFTLSIDSGSPVDTDFTTKAIASGAIVAAEFNAVATGAVVVPEPAALGLLGLGLGALAFVRRRRTI